MRAAIIASLVGAAVALFLFAWLAEEVFEGSAADFDAVVRNSVHRFASPPLTSAMVVVSHLGSEVLVAVVVVAVALFIRARWRRAAIWLALATLGGLLLETVLKLSYHRARPVPFFGVTPHSYSFPSGHSLMSFCVYGMLAGLLSHRVGSRSERVLVWVVAAVLIASIGVSRIYLGVHYPTDVLGGYLAAALWTSTLIFADRYRKHRRGR